MKLWEKVPLPSPATYHVSCVMYHVWWVMCNMPHVTVVLLFFFRQSGEACRWGFVINKANPSSFKTKWGFFVFTSLKWKTKMWKELYTEHCIIHTAPETEPALHTSQWALHTALHTFILHVTHLSLHTAHRQKLAELVLKMMVAKWTLIYPSEFPTRLKYSLVPYFPIESHIRLQCKALLRSTCISQHWYSTKDEYLNTLSWSLNNQDILDLQDTSWFVKILHCTICWDIQRSLQHLRPALAIHGSSLGGYILS